MIIGWGYTTIIGIFACATIGYVFRDGSDPWSAVCMISFLILFGKAWAWMFGQ